MREKFFARLHRATREVAKRVERENTLGDDVVLAKYNRVALKLFNSPGPVLRNVYLDSGPSDVQTLSFRRIGILAKREQVHWPTIDWEALLQWLYDNWELILRSLISLLILI